MSKPPSIDEYSTFAQDSRLILNRYRVTSSDSAVLDMLIKSRVYKFLLKNINFIPALEKFKSSRCKNSDPYIKEILAAKKSDNDAYTAVSLMSLFSGAMVACGSIMHRPKEELPTIQRKGMIDIAEGLEKALQFLEDGYFLIPPEITILQKQTLLALIKTCKNDVFYAYPRRSTGLELLAINHFVFNCYRAYRARYNDNDHTIQNIIMDLINIIDCGEHEESVRTWVKEAIRAYCILFKDYHFIMKDAKSIEKYGLISGR